MDDVRKDLRYLAIVIVLMHGLTNLSVAWGFYLMGGINAAYVTAGVAVYIILAGSLFAWKIKQKGV